MGRNLKAITSTLKKYANGGAYRARYFFANDYERQLPVSDNLALFQSFDGKNFGGNPFYILLEMRKHAEWDSIHAVVAVRRKAVHSAKCLLEAHSISNCEVVAINSKAYCRYLSTARYLINNSTFPTYFIKRDSQIYLNTWHGTPLKTMGRKMCDRPHKTGNTQRNFLMSDYLLYPNEYSLDHFKEDYMVSEYFEGKYLLAGYPCNSILLSDSARQNMREALQVPEDAHVVVYMPTWRQTPKGGQKLKHMHMAEFFLMNLDEHLSDNVIVFAKMHYYDSGKDVAFSDYKHIRPFPEDFETYEVLCAADALVTDYSSVMFDFLNARRPVYLYDYDRDEYFASRGTYISLDELPFKRTRDSYELCSWINDGASKGCDVDYSAACSKFCPYDAPDTAYRMCQLLFSGRDAEQLGLKVISGSRFHTNKKKVMIFGGALTKNGLTTALLGVLNNVNLSKISIMLSFYTKSGVKAVPTINSLSDDLNYYPMQGNQVMTYSEAVARYLYYRFDNQGKWVTRHIDNLYKREAARLFPGMHFDHVIHFTGYERNVAHLLLALDANDRIMYVHNDMVKELGLRSNFHVPSIAYGYRRFDKISVVRESLVETIENGFGIDRNKIHVVHNLNMIEGIKERARKSIKFDDDTDSNVSLESLRTLLEDKTIDKFIDVARFSPEKGLDRLIDAFKRYHKTNPDSALIIIGGHGKDYDAIRAMADELDDNRIVIIKNMSNPLSVLAQCDVFILSSLYEGLPMSIMEALILGKPVVSTAISGPKEFLEQGYGFLVDDSEEGVYQGFCAYRQGKLDSLRPFDAEAFNDQAMKEFLELIN